MVRGELRLEGGLWPGGQKTFGGEIVVDVACGGTGLGYWVAVSGESGE